MRGRRDKLFCSDRCRHAAWVKARAPLRRLWTDELIKRATVAVSRLRAAEVGGCFRPEAIPQGECSDGDCYCYRQCEREVRAVMEAVSDDAMQELVEARLKY